MAARAEAVVHTRRMEPEMIRALFSALHDENVDYVLIGALAMLYRMKRDTVRLRDKADAQVLEEKFGLKD